MTVTVTNSTPLRPAPPPKGNYVRVTKTAGLTLNKLGFHVTRDAFTAAGKHGCYWVRADELPEHIVANMEASATPVTASISMGVGLPLKKIRRTPVNSKTILVYSGVQASYDPDSARQIVFDWIVNFADKPIYRGTLYKLLRDGTDLLASTISSNLSYFVHDAGILTIVEKDES